MQGEDVILIFDPDCEGLVYNEKGLPLMGITGGNGSERHVDFNLCNNASSNARYILYIEVAANGLFGVGFNGGQINPPDPNRYFTLKTVELQVWNNLAMSLMWDLEVMLDIIKSLDDSQLKMQSLFTANKIVNTIKSGDHVSLTSTKEISKDFFKKQEDEGLHSIYVVGNCHIDTAWLWPFAETRRKVTRSFSTQCGLLETNPEYIFTASQMQQFEWLEEDQPLLFSRIQNLTKQKRFIPIGGTWVEMDCNIPSGESFCRQFLYGQSFMQEKFGFKAKVFWLPDTFGYSSQLPQIIKSAGLEYFFTQKLGWNNINKFPHTTFYWKGLDGTEVLTHFSPADTYSAQGTVNEVVRSVRNNKDKQYSNKSLLLLGNGDGGFFLLM
jgi:alpha-mannosidase